MDGAVKKYTYHRIAGYIFTLIVHVCNILYMQASIKAVVERDWDDKTLKKFNQLQGRFFTQWNVTVQIIHASAGLICELFILWNLNKKNYQLPKYLRGFRNTIFCGILWPSTLLVSSFFWTLYTYDRNLIFPPFIDKVLTVTTNHILHTLIVPIALWEVCYQPRIRPRSHFKNLGHLTFHMLLYLSVLFYTYIEQDIWIYPVFKQLYGTIYFPLLLLLVALILLFYYCIQWLLVWLIWGDLKIKSKKKK